MAQKLAVTLTALIKDIHSKSLVSGDKGTTITLQADNVKPELLDLLNQLHDPKRMVTVGIWIGK